MNKTTGVLVLGDQLSWQHPGLISAVPAEVVVTLARFVDELDSLRLNRPNIVFLLLSLLSSLALPFSPGFLVAQSFYLAALSMLLVSSASV